MLLLADSRTPGVGQQDHCTSPGGQVPNLSAGAGSAIVYLVSEPTHNWRPAALVGLRLRRVAVRWWPQAVALLIALELGLLSPLSCVIHCAMQRMLAERPALAFFLCGEHGTLAAPATPDIPPGSTPRASYELLQYPLMLLMVTSLLVAVLAPCPVQRCRPVTLPPPTPPPRPTHA